MIWLLNLFFCLFVFFNLILFFKLYIIVLVYSRFERISYTHHLDTLINTLLVFLQLHLTAHLLIHLIFLTHFKVRWGCQYTPPQILCKTDIQWDSLVASLVAQTVKNLPAMQEMPVWSLGQEDPLEKEMATHSSILAWETPWTKQPDGLQSRGLERIRHNLVTEHAHTFWVSAKAFGRAALWEAEAVKICSPVRRFS